MEKYKGTLTLTKITGYEIKSGYGWDYTHFNVYQFQDDQGKVYVWKTTTKLGRDVKINDKEIWFEQPTVDSVITISASVKGIEDYKGQHQIVLQRVKVIDIL